MADKWGALAQSLPAAITLTDAYTVPNTRRATIKVVICNQGGDALVRLSLATEGAADASEQYFLYDFSIKAGETKSTEQIALDDNDIVRVYSDTGTVTFNVNGIEEDKL